MFTRLSAFGLATAMFAGIAIVSGSATADSDYTKPFKGELEGAFVARDVATDPKAVGKGNVIGLGLTSVTIQVDGLSATVIGFIPPATLLIRFDTSTVWTAANGDQLFDTAVYDVAQNLGTGDATSTGTGTFTGGTGRFQGASGTYTLSNIVTAIPGDDNDPWTASVDGRISIVGSNQ